MRCDFEVHRAQCIICEHPKRLLVGGFPGMRPGLRACPKALFLAYEGGEMMRAWRLSHAPIGNRITIRHHG